ncbi:MAG TPA: GrpB family protein [Ktedonobacterales bacterium]
MTRQIVIVRYDARWRDEFREIGAPLRAALGDRALRIDHIGSTAVPGLAAKDRIDIQVTVAALDEEPLARSLAPLGYALATEIDHDHAPPGHEGDAPAEWRKLFFRAPEEQRPTNLHVRQVGRANQRYALLFRDYLRVDQMARGAYEQIKEALARLHPDDVDAYYAVKDPVCDIVMAAAERWASASNYTIGPSDI